METPNIDIVNRNGWEIRSYFSLESFEQDQCNQQEIMFNEIKNEIGEKSLFLWMAKTLNINYTELPVQILDRYKLTSLEEVCKNPLCVYGNIRQLCFYLIDKDGRYFNMKVNAIRHEWKTWVDTVRKSAQINNINSISED